MLGVLLTGFAAAQSPRNLITANSAGHVRLGMTVAQVRKAVAPMTLSRTSDGEGVALIAVKKGNKLVMTIYASEEDRDAKINNNAKVEQIWVWDPSYKTNKGVHAGILLVDAEKQYGKVNAITRSEIESREFAQFADQPDGIDFRLRGKDGMAGIYPSGKDTASTYSDGTIIMTVNVIGGDDASLGHSVKFSSEYTDLKTSCKTVGGNEGGHTSTFCKGPAGYQIHFFDSATTLEFNAENEEENFQTRLASEALDYTSRNSKVEWRLADGKPFAVMMRVFTYPAGGEFPKQGKPTGSFLVVKGLKGFETIDGKMDATTANANEKARELADNAFKTKRPGDSGLISDNDVPATRLSFSGGSNRTVASGKLENIDDKLKYVVRGKAGDRLTVKIEAKKWSGDEGPIMIGSVTMPDGSGEGAPGGTVFDSVLTQTGDYEILVYQNRAKSQTKNVELTVTVTLGSPTTQTLDEVAARYLPEGSKLMHRAVLGKVGGSERSVVALYGKEAPAITYSGLVLVPAAGGYKKYEMPQPEMTWSIEEPKAVLFANVDRDPESEMLIVGECYTGIGPTGAQPFYRTRVYDWKAGSFAHLDLISEEIGNLRTVATIRRQLPAIVKRAEAKFQRMDVDALNAKLSAAKGAKTPLQVLALLVDPFGDMLSRSVSIKADNAEDPESLLVVVTDDGYMDDSVRGEQLKFKLIKNTDGEWRVSTASKGWRCQAGRGHQGFSAVPCI
jgi:hypothetical protein